MLTGSFDFVHNSTNRRSTLKVIVTEHNGVVELALQAYTCLTNTLSCEPVLPLLSMSYAMEFENVPGDCYC